MLDVYNNNTRRIAYSISISKWTWLHVFHETFDAVFLQLLQQQAYYRAFWRYIYSVVWPMFILMTNIIKTRWTKQVSHCSISKYSIFTREDNFTKTDNYIISSSKAKVELSNGEVLSSNRHSWDIVFTFPLPDLRKNLVLCWRRYVSVYLTFISETC